MELADRYVEMWNEPDAERRRETIAKLWSSDAVHRLEPPQEVRETAAGLRTYALFEVRGHDELEARVRRAYEQFVEPGQFVFRRRGDGQRVGDTAKVAWEMVPAGGGDVAGSGVDFLVLDPDGRIRLDYQFIDP
jgi:SnoaL-like domain